MIAEYPHLLGHALGKTSLLPIHSQWIKYLFLPHKKRKNRMLMAYRGSFKSTCITVGVLWYLTLVNPNHNIRITSAKLELAKKVLSEIKHFFESEFIQVLYYTIYGTYNYIDKTLWRNEAINLTTKDTKTIDASIEISGVGQSLTGTHPQLVIMDDVCDIDDKVSFAKREFKKIWYDDTPAILNPGGHCAIIGTPWARDTIYENLPFEPLKFKAGTVPILAHTKEYFEEKKATMSRIAYASQYDLIHISTEDLIFKDPLYQLCPECKLIAYFDPAFGGKDFSALTVGGLHDKKIYIKYGFVWNLPLDKTYDKLFNYYVQTKAHELVIEDNAAQRAVVYEMKKRGIYSAKGVTNTKNKHIRIIDNIKQNWNRLYFGPNIQPEWMDQLLSYEEPDDITRKSKQAVDVPDSLAGLISRLSSKSWKVVAKI